MATPVKLSEGDHLIVEDVVHFTARYEDAHPPVVTLTASVQSLLHPVTTPSPVPTATTLALVMDARVALDLYRRIGEVAKQMGWQLPK